MQQCGDALTVEKLIPAGSVLHHRTAQLRAETCLPGPALYPVKVAFRAPTPGLSVPFRLTSWHSCPRKEPLALLLSAQFHTLCSQPVSEADTLSGPLA